MVSGGRHTCHARMFAGGVVVMIAAGSRRRYFSGVRVFMTLDNTLPPSTLLRSLPPDTPRRAVSRWWLHALHCCE